MKTRATPTYESAADLWVLTSYFNPVGYRSRAQNSARFREHFGAGGFNLLIVECAFGDAPFASPKGPDVLHVRASDVMWQKERLLNIALAKLPPHCTKVAWIDCDVVFENSAWAVETSRLLDRYPVVQPFDLVVSLPRGTDEDDGSEAGYASFGARSGVAPRRDQPRANRPGQASNAMTEHGHTGYGWAIRREIIGECGLYDACIIGGGDHLMAHAMSGTMSGRCIERAFADNRAHAQHFVRWSERIYPDVRGQIGYTAGTLLHLWHGHGADRRYVSRHRELAAFAFDPDRDLRTAANGCWEWASDKPAMHAWAAGYFAERQEDGGTTAAINRVPAANAVR